MNHSKALLERCCWKALEYICLQNHLFDTGFRHLKGLYGRLLTRDCGRNRKARLYNYYFASSSFNSTFLIRIGQWNTLPKMQHQVTAEICWEKLPYSCNIRQFINLTNSTIWTTEMSKQNNENVRSVLQVIYVFSSVLNRNKKKIPKKKA